VLVDLVEPDPTRGLQCAVAAVGKLLDALAVNPLPQTTEEVLDGCWDDGRPRALVDGARAVMDLDAGDRADIARAFHDDIRFTERLDDPDFEFAWDSLPPDASQAAKGLLVAMYEAVLAGGGFKLDDGTKLTTAKFEEPFRAANPKLKLCPACLSSKLEFVPGESRAYDLEHAFPKSRYPVLAVHHHNLLPACMECNQRYHGDTDPLSDDGDARLPIGAAYVPYLRSAEGELRVDFDPLAEPRERVILGADTDEALRRVRTHVRLYRIETRWGTTVEDLYDRIRLHLLDLDPVPGTEDAVREELLKYAGRYRRQVRWTPDALIESEYAAWLAEQGLKSLVKELTYDGP
jgi:hypothetical protein